MYTFLHGTIGNTGSATHWLSVRFSPEGKKTVESICASYCGKGRQIPSRVRSISYSPIEITCKKCLKLNPPSQFDPEVIARMQAK